MKIHTNPQAGTRAASLITVMVICAVLSFSAIGYLALVTQQNSLSARSQLWNMAIAMSEAGIEEGLQHINSNTNLTSEDDWTPNGSFYTLTRTFPNGNSYTVKIDASSPSNPIITSRASIQLSTFAVAQNAPSVFVASQGVNLSPSTGSPGALSRAVRVTASRSGLFLAAMVAKKGVDLKGNGVKTDSFDSGDLNKSTNGHYDPTKAGDKGDVASNDGIVGVVSVQNANIWGHVRTGKGGTASIGSQGAVGSVAWQLAGNKGIEPGWATEDANFTFPDTTLPYSSGLDPQKDKDIVTAIGVTTNSTYVNGSTTYPGTPPVGSTISAIVTNISTITTTTHPGSQPGLTTNVSYTTVTSYPGAIPGLMTNNAGFTTVSSYPGPQPGLTTNLNNGGHVKDYTYATSFNYTFPTPTYSYSTQTYSYNLYQTVTIYETNRYDNVLVSGNYYYDSAVPLKKVYVSGKATLVLPQGLTMSGNDQFVLGPLGSITIYSGGNSITVGSSSSGLNAVENPSGYAGNFVVYCAPSVTDFTLNGNGEFIGVLVAPNADIKMNGGGSGYDDFTGALMVNSVRMNGHFKFHYDEALSRMPATGRFLITSWDEIK